MELSDVIDGLEQEVGSEQVTNLETYTYWFAQEEAEILGIDDENGAELDALIAVRRSVYLRHVYLIIKSMRLKGYDKMIKFPIKTREEIRNDVYVFYNVERKDD